MSRDVPAKAHDSGDMHQMERVTELLRFQEEVEGILHHRSEDAEESTSEVVETVATNTTR